MHSLLEGLRYWHLGKNETIEPAVFYQKTSVSTYKVWYSIGFESNVYRSQTKDWKEVG